jgi:amino acid adenylation domain-containing protein/thioester reductase-like protein/non-ribosomal peptide synthase protein (TIGR01720 family)
MGLENVEDIYRLSPVQQGMLFHTLVAPEGGVYFEQFSPAYGKGFDPAAFERAWQQTLDRHPVLRTSFLWEDLEEPVQVVHRQVKLTVDRQDWRGLPAAEQRQRLADYMAADRRRGFDLQQSPLLRLGVVRLGDEDYRVVWSYHHLLLDGWSAGLVMREVLAVYLAAARGQAAALEPRRPYKDYILWLRQQDLTAAEAWWRGVLAGFAEPTPLGVDSAPAGGQADAAYELRLARVGADATARLKSFAQRSRLTLSTLVQGAWALLLSRYGGSRDVVFGVTVSGRPPALQGVDSMLGCFINTLPMRVRVPPAAELGAWLKELQASGLELRRFEHSPLQQVLGWSAVPRQLPLFESIVVYEGFTADSAFEMTHAGVFQRTNYPLTLTTSPGDELSLRIGYEPGRFAAAAMLRLLRHLETLFEAMAAGDPGRPLAALPLVSAAERQQLLREWNDTESDYSLAALAARARGAGSGGACLHQPFEAWAARAPGATALVFERESWSYGDLDGRANQLARLLVALGVGAGTLVGVHLERSCEMVVAVLAIHKAGGAYVPLECGWPAARIRWILASQGIAHVLTQAARVEGLLAREPSGSPPGPAHVVCLDWRRPGAAAETAEAPPAPPAGAGPIVWSAADFEVLPGGALPARCGPDDLAYILFTSGSTGNPKGVMVCHAAAVHLIEWVNRTFDVGPADRLLFVTALSFDLSVYDIFGILAAGGTVRIASAAELQDPEAQVRILCREPITFWDSAPAALQQLAPFFPAPGALAEPPALRLVFQSGDWIPVTLPDRVREVFTRARFISLGGATEATIWSNFHPVGEVDPAWASIPYGRPIADARYLILDADGNPCPIGVPGYLHIGGDCLSSGYAQEPGLTAAQYVPCAYGERPGERLYFTGDRVRLKADGVMEFLGRVDTQVKVRGFRIELGEIEAALANHPAVREAVVEVREQDGHRRLVAYLVGKEEGGLPPAGELRAHLAERLPEYMLPAAWVVLQRLPLTPNGKLDRKALPAPEAAVGEGEYLPPRTPVERELAAIWSAVLKVERVGVDENFFELGGDSILSLQVVSRAGRAGLRLAPRQLFDHPTVGELAAVLDGGGDGAGAGAAAAEEQGPASGPLPPTPAARWFFARRLEEPWHFNQSVLLEAREGLAPPALAGAVRALLAHHDALRLRAVPVGGEPAGDAAGGPAEDAAGGLESGPSDDVAGGPADDAAGEPQGGEWRLRIAALDEAPAGGGRLPVAWLDLSALAAADQPAAIAGAAAAAQASLDLAAGPLLRAVAFRLGAGRADRLLLVIHHLAVDGVSWRVLLEDLESAYAQLAAGAAVRLPAKTTSLRRWSELLAEWASSPRLAEELAYWLAPERRRPVTPLPVDLPAGEEGRPGAESDEMASAGGAGGTGGESGAGEEGRPGAAGSTAGWAGLVASEASARVELSAEETRALLQEAGRAYRTRTEELLLAALVRAFAGWTGEPRLLLELEGHGREAPPPAVAGGGGDAADLSRTVGWLTAIYPLLLDLSAAGEGPGEAISAVKEQLRAVPGRGLGYGLLRWLAPQPEVREALAALAEPQVGFNYLGQFDGTLAETRFAVAAEGSGPMRSALQRRRCALDVDAAVAAGRLTVRFGYSASLHRAATVERLAAAYLDELRRLLAHCRRPDAWGVTPSDFPLTALDQAALARVVEGGRRVEDLYPLAPAQQELLVHQLAEPHAGAGVRQLVCTLDGELDPAAFAAAWRRLPARHAMLRTAFFWQGLERPLQGVMEEAEAPLGTADWAALEEPERRRELADLLAWERAQGFALERAPLLRAALLRLGETRHALVVSHHRLLLDRESAARVLDDLLALHEGLRRGEPAEPPRPRPYRDYVEWLSRQPEAAAEAYWRQTLQGFAAPTPLGFDREAADGPGGERRRRLSEPASAALRAAARRMRVTLAALLEGAWAVLLSRYSGERDVVFGGVSPGRPEDLAGAESMVGPFATTLPVRVRAEPEVAVGRWLGQIQEHQVERSPHRHSALGRVREWSEVGRGQELFASALDVATAGPPAAEPFERRLGAGLTVAEVEPVEHTRHGLLLAVAPERRLCLRLLYDGRFDAASVERRLGHLETLLAGLAAAAAAAPERLLGELPLLGAAEQAQLLGEWKDAPPARTPMEEEAAATGPEGPLGGAPAPGEAGAAPPRAGLEEPRVAPRGELERTVAEAWQDVLQIERLGVRDDFFDLGGTSWLQVRAQDRVREALGRDLPLADLLRHRTVESTARAIGDFRTGALLALGPTGNDELRADAVLDPAVRPGGPPPARVADPATVLLTGGSGFLGAYLLAELLRQTRATVVCLVRAATVDKGLAKLQRELSTYGLWDAAQEPRIRPLLGDLGQPAFGLSQPEFDELAEEIDAIYHNGAAVNFLAPYPALREANVLGTLEILRLACAGRAKPLHYVSTIAVLDSAAHAGAAPVGEDAPLGDCRGLRGGYAQSKWVAEKLVAAARERGLAAAVYRPGTISADSRTGAGNPRDFAISLVKSFIQLGAVPEMPGEVNLAPVDYVARAIVWLSRQGESAGRTFHMINPRPCSGPELIAWLRRYGYPLEQLTADRWRAALIASIEAGSDNALLPFLPLYQAAAEAAAAPTVAVENRAPASAAAAPPVEVHCRHTTAALAAGSVRCPPVGDELLTTYFRHLIESGYLPPPPAAAATPADPGTLVAAGRAAPPS